MSSGCAYSRLGHAVKLRAEGKRLRILIKLENTRARDTVDVEAVPDLS